MSTAHLPATMRSNAPDQQSTVQKLLDENSRLIDIIQEYQNQSRADEATKHQQLLHRNLVHLSNLAEPMLLNQLKDDATLAAEAQAQQQAAHAAQQQAAHAAHQAAQAAAHHHPSPGGPMPPPPHGFAPPPEMMNHQAYQMRGAPQGQPPPQGYPQFGQPAPQMGGQRMPYPYPQGMPGYPGGPPPAPHGYEGYQQQPPQGYMR